MPATALYSRGQGLEIILDSWIKLEKAVIRLQQENGLVRFTNYSTFFELLLKKEIITKQEFELFKNLQRIRSHLTHFTETKIAITLEAAVEFNQSAELLVAKLNQIEGSINL